MTRKGWWVWLWFGFGEVVLEAEFFSGREWVAAFFLLGVGSWKGFFKSSFLSKSDTLAETNIAPENRLSQEEMNLSTIEFQGLH